MSEVRQEFLLPALGGSIDDVTIVEWLVAVGDRLVIDRPICAVDGGEGGDSVLTSPFAGVVLELGAAAGERVAVGELLIAATDDSPRDATDAAPATGTGTDSDASPDTQADAATDTDPDPDTQADADAGVEADTQADTDAELDPDTQADTDAELDPDTQADADAELDPDTQADADAELDPDNGVGRVRKYSPLVRRLAEEFGVDLESVAGSGPGGRVTRDDVHRAAFPGQPLPTEPSHGGATGVAPGPSWAEAEPDAAEPGATEPEAIPVGAEPGATEPEAIPVGAEPGATEPEAIPVGAEPGATEPEAIPVGGEPGATEPDTRPESADSETVDNDPEPKLVDPEPEPHPDSSELGSDSKPVDVAVDKVSDGAESASVRAETLVARSAMTLAREVEAEQLLRARSALGARIGRELSSETMLVAIVADVVTRFPELHTNGERADIGVLRAGAAGLERVTVHDANRRSLVEVDRAVDDPASNEPRAAPSVVVIDAGAMGLSSLTPALDASTTVIVTLGQIRRSVDIIDGLACARAIATLTATFDSTVVDLGLASRFVADLALCIDDPILAFVDPVQPLEPTE